MIRKLLLSYGMYEAVAKGLNIGLTLVLAALISTKLFGQVALIIPLEQILVELINFGQCTIVLRNYRRADGNRGLILGPSWAIMATVAAILLIVSTLLFFAGPRIDQLAHFGIFPFWLFLVSCLAQASINLYLAYSRGKEDVATYGKVRTYFQISKFILCVGLFKISPRFESYILGGLLASLTALGLIHLRDRISVGVRTLGDYVRRDSTKENFWMGFPLAVSGVMAGAYSLSDRFIIGGHLDKEAVAVYSFAYTQGSSIFFVVNVLAIAYLPKIFSTEEYSVVASSYLGRFTGLAFGATALASLVVCFLVFPVSLRFVRPEYAAGHTVLWLVCVSMLFTALKHHGTYLLMFLRKVSIIPAITAVTLSVNVILNLKLIPRYGINGVAFATVASEASAMLLLTAASQYFLRAQTRMNLELK